MTKDEALDLALEFFETMQRYKGTRSNIFIRFEPTATGDYVDLREFDGRAKPIITAIKQARSAPVQEPVGVFREDDDIGHVDLMPHQQMKLKDGDLVYAAPPKAPVQEPAIKQGWDVDTLLDKPAAPVQEPVAVDCCANCLRPEREHQDGKCPKPFTTVWHAWDYDFPPDAPPVEQRRWVGLTDDERYGIRASFRGRFLETSEFAEQVQLATEAKLKEKNT